MVWGFAAMVFVPQLPPMPFSRGRTYHGLHRIVFFSPSLVVVVDDDTRAVTVFSKFENSPGELAERAEPCDAR